MARIPHVPKLCVRKDGRFYATDPHLKRPVYFKSADEYEQWRAAFLARVREQAKTVEPAVLSGHRLSVARLCEAYLAHARLWYRKDGEPTSEVSVVEMMLKRLNAVAGDKQVDQLRVADVEAFLARCIDDGLARRTINGLLRRLRTMSRWAVRKEVLSGETLGRILSVGALQKGRTAAREKPKVKAVPSARVEAVLPHLNRTYAAMVRLELQSGMRPGEVVSLTAAEIDRSGQPWEYLPARYKTEHLHDEDEDKRRRIFFGPQARAVLEPFLARCHSPKSPLFRGRGGKPVTLDAYYSAVRRACKKAAVPHFHPNMLRHAAGTAVRAKYGAEEAQKFLGHENLRTTEIYAERDWEMTRRIVEETG